LSFCSRFGLGALQRFRSILLLGSTLVVGLSGFIRPFGPGGDACGLRQARLEIALFRQPCGIRRPMAFAGLIS
jgi:hypothetical protein